MREKKLRRVHRQCIQVVCQNRDRQYDQRNDEETGLKSVQVHELHGVKNFRVIYRDTLQQKVLKLKSVHTYRQTFLL